MKVYRPRKARTAGAEIFILGGSEMLFPKFCREQFHKLVRQSQIVQSVIDSSGTVVPY